MQPDTGSLPSKNRELTDDQLSFWARRGYLLLKGFIGPEAVRDLRAWRDGFRAGQSPDHETGPMDCIRQLADLVETLTGAEVELLRVGPGPAATPIGRGRWRAGERIAAKGGVAMIPLSPSSTSGREVIFYPQSHLIPHHNEDVPVAMEMQHVAEALRSRGITRHTLGCRPGDVWLRHPDLVSGTIPSARAAGRGADDLEAVFCVREDIPTDGVQHGLAGVLGHRTATGLAKAETSAHASVSQEGATDPRLSLRQTTTNGFAV